MEQGTRSYTKRKLKHSQLSSPSSLYIFPSFCVFYSFSTLIFTSHLSLSPLVSGEIFSFLNYPSQRRCVLSFDINPGAYIKDFFLWRVGSMTRWISNIIICTQQYKQSHRVHNLVVVCFSHLSHSSTITIPSDCKRLTIRPKRCAKSLSCRAIIFAFNAQP